MKILRVSEFDQVLIPIIDCPVIRHIEVIRKGVGDKIALGVDANQGWLVSIVDRLPAWDLERATAFAGPVPCGHAGCGEFGPEMRRPLIFEGP